MKPVRFIMIGGFLGAGKTTTIARLAQHYIDQGLNVGLVTNDQAYNLVDTQSLRAQGFRVGEVPGACFCCKFDDLVTTANSLSADEIPDIIIAEPVGSCTDLVATVIEPLRHLYADQFTIGPLAVLLKPEHGRKILRNEQRGGFSPKAEYIFLKQIEEADVVAVNKIDKLTADETNELVALIGERFPDKQVLAISSKQGDAFGELVAAVADESSRHATFMEVDYDVYAEGEAELGWLNCQLDLSSADHNFELDNVLVQLVSELAQTLRAADAEPAHLKVLGQIGEATGIANLVDSETDAELSLESGVKAKSAEFIINARVATDPERLEELVRHTVQTVAARCNLIHDIRGMQRFRPGRPMPTHRMTS